MNNNELAKVIKFNFDNDFINKNTVSVQASILELSLAKYENAKDKVKFIFDNKDAILEGMDAFTNTSVNIEDDQKVYAKLRRRAWNTLLNDSGLTETLPSKIQDEFRESLDDNIVEFNYENTKNTLLDLLSRQDEFLTQRVVGIYNKLSPNHKTNEKFNGFYKRFIMNYSEDLYYSSRSNYIDILHDLRLIVNNGTTGRYISYNDTIKLLATIPTDGKWVDVDGCRFKVRRYSSTMHIEVNEDVCSLLNELLSKSAEYGSALKDYNKEVLTKRKTKSKAPALRSDFIDSHILKILNDFNIDGNNTISHRGGLDKFVIKELRSVLNSIGATLTKEDREVSGSFGYSSYKLTFLVINLPCVDVNESLKLIKQLYIQGCIPEQKSHQFYPTPAEISEFASDNLNINNGDVICEPNVGTGNLLKNIVNDNNKFVCYDVAEHFVNVTKTRFNKDNVNVYCKDFLSVNDKFDKIIMNPPYTGNQWKSHTQHAMSLLNNDGCIVAILPQTAATGRAWVTKGYTIEVLKTYNDKFDNCSVNVVVVRITKD